jgi:hypothetical protein
MPDPLDKKQAERAIGIAFLELYNSIFDTGYQIVKHDDAPDLHCADPSSGRPLYLEISLLDDFPGWIEHVLAGKPQRVSPHTGTTAVSFTEDVVPLFEQQIGRKLLSRYGRATALVFYNTTALWGPLEWRIFKAKYAPALLAGNEHNYGAGIWVLCADFTTQLDKRVLFCLSEPTCPPPSA